MIDIDNEPIAAFYRRNKTLGSSIRNERLDYYESFYQCVEYDGRGADFQGRILAPGGAAQAGLGPQYDSRATQSAEDCPYEERRPPAPSRLASTIIQTLTGELFADSSHPTIRVLGDRRTQEFVDGIVSAGQLWAAFTEARNLGGAIGSVVVAFSFVDGTPCFEVVNSKFCVPIWRNRATNDLDALEVTYQYPVEVRTRKGWETRWFWYRRHIGRSVDVVFKRVPVSVEDVTDSSVWVPSNVVEHAFGEVPAVWMQNTRDSQQVDGRPDCYGQFDAILQIDTLYGLAAIGTIPNCDPTAILATKKTVGQLRKGSKNAIVLDPGESASYLELSGTGATTAMSVADKLKSQVQEACAVVLPSSSDANAAAATATEIRHRYRAFHAHIDGLRQQYGAGLKVLTEKMLRAARKLLTPQVRTSSQEREPELGRLTIDSELPPVPSEFNEGQEDESAGRPTSYSIKLPPRVIDTDEDPETPSELQERELGPGGVVEVTWPAHVTPVPTEVQTQVAVLSAAEAAGYIDNETAAGLFAQFIGLEDAGAVYRKAQGQKTQRDAAEAAKMKAALEQAQTVGGFGNGPPEDDDGASEDDTQDDDNERLPR